MALAIVNALNAPLWLSIISYSRQSRGIFVLNESQFTSGTLLDILYSALSKDLFGN